METVLVYQLDGVGHHREGAYPEEIQLGQAQGFQAQVVELGDEKALGCQLNGNVVRQRTGRNDQASGVNAQVVPGRSAVGGGSLPGETLPTHLVALVAASPDSVAARLRAGEPPVLTRIEDDRVVLDPRTVLPEQEAVLMPLVAEAVR